MISDRISIAFMTNCTKNAPNINTQANTIKSLYKEFQINIILPTYIFIDPKPNHQIYDKYIDNLKNITEFKNAIIIGTEGLPDGYIRSLSIINTPYIFFLEHDWAFQNIRVSLINIISWMDIDNNINTILFNKRTNYIAGADKILINHGHNLTLTNRQSNNPNIFRVDFAKKYKLNLLKRKKGCSLHPKIEDCCQGIECEFEKFVDIDNDMIKLFGTFLYGNIGYKSTIIHLNGK